GPITDLAGLKSTANGQTLAWTRDHVDMYAIHLTVPPGATTLEASLDYLSPASPEGFSSAASASDKMTVVSWNQALLYPATAWSNQGGDWSGTRSDDLQYQATLKLPAGWKFGTALPVARQEGETI